MVTKNDLVQSIKQMGILPTDTVMVHVSLKQIGTAEAGADTVIDALCESLTDGLLVLPGHTWSTINAQNPEFDVKNSPVCVGVMPEVFRKRKGVYRSLHPTHSLLAFGNGAEEFVRGQEVFDTPCAPESCYGQMEKRNGKVLFIGVNFMKCTLVHCIEEVARIPGRLTDTREPLRVKTESGEILSVPSRRHDNANSDHYEKLEPVLDWRGALTRGKIGEADSIVCGIRDLFTVTLELLKKNPRLFDDFEPVPKSWY